MAISYTISADVAHDERWDAKRLEAYASYGLAVKRFILIASRISASRGLGPQAQPLSANEENLEQLAQAEVDRATAWEQVLLIGDPATIASARRWHQRAWELEHFARGVRTAKEGWAATYAAADDARAEFYRNARRDLSVVGIPPASGDHLPPVSLRDDGKG